MLLNAGIAIISWLLFNAARLSMAKDSEIDNDEITWPIFSAWIKRYSLKSIDNWIASLFGVPILLYYGHNGLAIPDFGAGPLDWKDGYYPAAGFVTEILMLIYKKVKSKFGAPIVILFALSLPATAQVSDADLKTEVDTKIKGKIYNPNITSTFLKLLIDSKVNVSDGGGGSVVFDADIPVVLSGGKTIGQYTNGQTIPANGKTVQEVITLLATEYINPSFSAFSISGQATTVEIGTTLSGSKTFLWTLSAGSGTVSTIDIYNNTAASTLVAGTANDGTQAATITTIQLNTNGATQSWKGIGNNTSPPGTFNSSDFVVTARYIRFYGATASAPTNSAQVRALSTNAFHTGAATFNLTTGTTLTRFAVALPPSVTISSVIDLDALNADITSQYVLTGTVSVTDAGGTSRTYNLYQMTIGAAYSVTHRHQITTAN
jgi:hypothetical protein